jgi:hypothetical protein
MSLLRRAHAYHRDFRTLEPTTCAAASAYANRDDAVVTRHGLPPSPTAAPSLRSPTRGACCTPDRAIRTHSDCRLSVLRSQLADYPAIQIKPPVVVALLDPHEPRAYHAAHRRHCRHAASIDIGELLARQKFSRWQPRAELGAEARECHLLVRSGGVC